MWFASSVRLVYFLLRNVSLCSVYHCFLIVEEVFRDFGLDILYRGLNQIMVLFSISFLFLFGLVVVLFLQ